MIYKMKKDRDDSDIKEDAEAKKEAESMLMRSTWVQR